MASLPKGTQRNGNVAMTTSKQVHYAWHLPLLLLFVIKLHFLFVLGCGNHGTLISL